MNEEWRSVLDGFYEITVDGKVRRAKPGKGARFGKLLRHFIASTGYPVVNVCVAGKPHVAYVHALIAEAFIGKRPPRSEINHRDGNKANYNIANLEYVTRSQNMQHAWDNGLMRPDRRAAQ